MVIPQQKINTVGQKHRLDFIILHGSKATGKTPGPDTDIDLAICRHGEIPHKEFFEIYQELSEIFPKEDVDLKTLHRQPPLLKFHVARDGRLLFGNQTAFQEFKAYAYQNYIDAQPLFATEKQLLQKGLRAF